VAKKGGDYVVDEPQLIPMNKDLPGLDVIFVGEPDRFDATGI